ncbi:MAG TPA: hypothetical protein VEW46_00610 [Pyrinomonadaceae bacterium]|nr:hypothetical protein [Pyrinomonadaceae bacterium]
MKKYLKRSLIVVALVLLASVVSIVWLATRPDKQATVSDASLRASFEVNVERPRMDRFLGGILPTRIEATLLGGELRFDHRSSGARVGRVGHDRLDLSADGWELLIETDGEGRVTPGTRLMFPIEIAEKNYTLRCRPADRANGYLRTNTPAGSDVLDVSFLVELARCEDAKTGKILDTEAGGNPGDAWPSSPLTLRGNFVGPATLASPVPK